MIKTPTLTFVFFLFISCLGLAQTAPDFDVIDTKGNQHVLYSDYLIENKTVLVKIFYSSCPPCHSIADDLEVLYQEWGAGNHDVQFIEVSSQSWETNQTIQNNFLSVHDITFPSVSAEGGSIQVVNDFIDADFGPFYGTPTFIVVAPDGSVQWDVDGFGNAGKIAAIDAALAATGAVKPVVSSLGEIEKPELNLSITPNPASDYLNLELDLPESGMLLIDVYSILGTHMKTLISGNQSAGLVEHLETINTWKSGTYFLRIQFDDSILRTVRFVKN